MLLCDLVLKLSQEKARFVKCRARPDLVVLGTEAYRVARTAGHVMITPVGVNRMYLLGMRAIASHDVPPTYVGVFCSAPQ